MLGLFWCTSCDVYDNDRSRLAIWNDSKGWMESALLVKEKE